MLRRMRMRCTRVGVCVSTGGVARERGAGLDMEIVVVVENCEDDETCPARDPPPSATEPSVQAATKDNARLSCEPGRRTATVTAPGDFQRSTESASAVSSPGTALETAETSRRHGEGQARQTTVPVLTESPAQPTAREGEGGRRASWAASSPTLRTQPIPGPLIEEPPPLYSSLFPAASVTTHSSSTNADRQAQPQLGQPQTIHQHPQFAQRCSVCHTTQPPLSHNRSPHLYRHHHTPRSPLPGMIGQHYPEHYPPPREQPQYHTIVPMHTGAERHNGSHDYTKLAFLCVLVCTLHLNLPALLCVLPALAYSIRAQKLNAERRYRRAAVYSKSALTCNLLALGQYVVCVVAAAIVGLYILFND